MFIITKLFQVRHFFIFTKNKSKITLGTWAYHSEAKILVLFFFVGAFLAFYRLSEPK